MRRTLDGPGCGCRRWIPGSALLAIAAAAHAPAQAYVFSGSKWPSASAQIQSGIPVSNGTQGPVDWALALEEAAGRWTTYTGFDLTAVTEFADPCLDDFKNGVGFRDRMCGGAAFGATTLAITITSFNPVTDTILESDISFNSNKAWDVYSGPLRQENDFRRVAVHELGHSLGFRHEDSPGVSSIMASFVSTLETPQATDIQGVSDVYGVTPPPPPGLDPSILAAAMNVIYMILFVEE